MNQKPCVTNLVCVSNDSTVAQQVRHIRLKYSNFGIFAKKALANAFITLFTSPLPTVNLQTIIKGLISLYFRHLAPLFVLSDDYHIIISTQFDVIKLPLAAPLALC